MYNGDMYRTTRLIYENFTLVLKVVRSTHVNKYTNLALRNINFVFVYKKYTVAEASQ